MTRALRRGGRLGPRRFLAAVLVVVAALPAVAVAGLVGPVTPAGAEVLTGWHHRDLTAEIGAPLLDGTHPTAFHTDSGPRVYYIDSQENVQELYWAQARWNRRDLTALTGAMRPVNARSLVGFPLSGIGVRLYYVDRSFHVRELDLSNGVWRTRDLTADTGVTPVHVVDQLTAFAISRNQLRVYATMADDRIHEFAYSQNTWTHHDITALTGAAAPLDAELVAFPVSSTDVRLYYRTPGATGASIWELRQTQGTWSKRNITAAAGAPFASGGSMAGFHTGGVDARIYFEDRSDHLHELSFFLGSWRHRDITVAADVTQSGYRAISAYRVGDTNDYRVYAVSGNHLREFASATGSWSHVDVSQEAGIPQLRNGGGQSTAFALNGANSRVYTTDGGHIHEFAYTAETPGPGPEPEMRAVSLQRQPIWEGFIPYTGHFPAFGIVPAGRLIQIRVPQQGIPNLSVVFVKAGRATTECNNPNSVVVVNAGQTTTPAQIVQIFGQAEPRFSILTPLTFVACGAFTGPVPNWINIEIAVNFG